MIKRDRNPRFGASRCAFTGHTGTAGNQLSAAQGAAEPLLLPLLPTHRPTPSALARSCLSAIHHFKEQSDADGAVSTPHPIIIIVKMGSTINFPRGTAPSMIGKTATTCASVCYSKGVGERPFTHHNPLQVLARAHRERRRRGGFNVTDSSSPG